MKIRPNIFSKKNHIIFSRVELKYVLHLGCRKVRKREKRKKGDPGAAVGVLMVLVLKLN